MAGLLPFDINGTATRGFIFGSDGDVAGKVKSLFKDNEDPNAVQRLINEGVVRREALKLTPTSQAQERHADETVNRFFTSSQPVSTNASLQSELDANIRSNRIGGVLAASRGHV
jgi:hypothetical protein